MGILCLSVGKKMLSRWSLPREIPREKSNIFIDWQNSENYYPNFKACNCVHIVRSNKENTIRIKINVNNSQPVDTLGLSSSHLLAGLLKFYLDYFLLWFFK